MKQYYILTAVFFFTVSLKAQIINIPDAQFKAGLLSAGAASSNNQTIVLDANGNGEIEVEEAGIVTGLSVYDKDIVSLEGIQYFTNLEVLVCQSNKIENFDYDLPFLRILWCDNNRLTHFNMSHFPRLTWLQCGDNLLTSLDFRQNELEFLVCRNNLLEEIHFGVLSDGFYMVAANNRLTSLDIINRGKNIHRIEIFNNPLVHLNIEAQSFDYLICSNTLLTHLDLSKIGRDEAFITGDFEISNNPNLRSINLKNNASHFCIRPASFNCSETTFTMQNNPLLETVCADEGSETEFLQPYATALGFTLTSDCVLGINNTAVSESTIYPNPANEIMNIHSKVGINQVRILNMLGQVVAVVNAAHNNDLNINVMDLKSGAYFVEIISDKGKSVQKLVKQ